MADVLVIGVVSSLVAAAILLLLQIVFRDYVLPKWAARRQGTPSIAGVWDGFELDSEHPDQKVSRLEIQQTGTRIKAKVIRQKQGDARERIFTYEGKFLSGQLLLFFEEPKGAGFIVGTMVLVLESNLDELQGKSTYYHHTLKRVVSENRLYRRLPG